MFDSYQLKLFPIALLISKAEEMEKKIQKEQKNQGRANQISSKSNIDSGSNRQGENENQAKEFSKKPIIVQEDENEGQTSRNINEITFEEAYQQLLSSSPKNEIQKSINSYLIQKLKISSKSHSFTEFCSPGQQKNQQSNEMEFQIENKTQKIILIDENNQPEPNTNLEASPPQCQIRQFNSPSMTPSGRRNKRTSFRKSMMGSLKFKRKTSGLNQHKKSEKRSGVQEGVVVASDDLRLNRCDSESSKMLSSFNRQRKDSDDKGFSGTLVASRFAAAD